MVSRPSRTSTQADIQTLTEFTIARPGFLKRFNHAAYRSLATDDYFQDCYLPARAQGVAADMFEILRPLVGPRTEENNLLKAKGCIEDLCKQAFKFRAALLLHDLRKYEMLLYKPGDLFQPATMQAQRADGSQVEFEDNMAERRIKLCMHGLIMEYKDATDTESIDGGQDGPKALSKDFIVRENGMRDDGKLVTDRAIVILEE